MLIFWRNLCKDCALIWFAFLHCKFLFLFSPRLAARGWTYSFWLVFTVLSFWRKWFFLFSELFGMYLAGLYLWRSQTFIIRAFVFFIKIRWLLSSPSLSLLFSIDSSPVIHIFKKSSQFWLWLSLTNWVSFLLIHLWFDICYLSIQIIPTFLVIIWVAWATACWISTDIENAFKPICNLVDSTFFRINFLFRFSIFNWLRCRFFLYDSFFLFLAVNYSSFLDNIRYIWIAATFVRFFK